MGSRPFLTSGSNEADVDYLSSMAAPASSSLALA
jgi:hypothetical protein